MGRKRKSGSERIAEVVRKSEAAGLSYGQYVARERERQLKHKLAPKSYTSINERDRNEIPEPIYDGIPTRAYGAAIDYPNYLQQHAKKCYKKRGRKKKCATN